jgi:hypothetical protein
MVVQAEGRASISAPGRTEQYLRRIQMAKKEQDRINGTWYTQARIVYFRPDGETYEGAERAFFAGSCDDAERAVAILKHYQEQLKKRETKK